MHFAHFLLLLLVTGMKAVHGTPHTEASCGSLPQPKKLNQRKLDKLNSSIVPFMEVHPLLVSLSFSIHATKLVLFLKTIFLDSSLPFPASYPTGCLLGCVDLLDCVSQEDFRENVIRMCMSCSSCWSCTVLR